jgi:PIN domain nuclease of toxin-antitoxin system
VSQALVDLDMTLLPITVIYADVQSTLHRHHGDPFDRMIVAQAIADGITIVSSDSQLDAYGVTRIG